MVTSNIPLGSIVAPNVDIGPIKTALETRGAALGSQLPSDAAAQLQSDVNAYEVVVDGSGDSVSFKTQMNESYLVGYLASHGTPISGGDGGTAHNLDGSTYTSRVPHQLQGTPLPWYELPIVEVESELNHVVELMAHDAVENAMSKSSSAIAEAVKPEVIEMVRGLFS